MKDYKDLIEKVLNEGEVKEDRTGVGTISIFGTMSKHNFSDGFPANTYKKLFWKPVVGELLFFMEGATNLERLRELTWGKDSDKMTIWDANYNKQAKDLGYTNGELGPIYGAQWREFGKSGSTPPYTRKGVDQLANAIDMIKNDPTSRRILVSAWNPVDLPRMTLPPCHYSFQFNVSGDYLDILYNMRSNDLLLGRPFNDASYGLLLCIVAKMTGKTPRYMTASIGDAHIYANHVEGAKELIQREELPLPSLEFPDFTETDTVKQIEEAISWGVDSYKLIGYNSHPPIRLPMAV